MGDVSITSSPATVSTLKSQPAGTDPTVYNLHHQTFNSAPLPHSGDEWIKRAAQVAAILAEDATVRNAEEKIPYAEVSLLKSSGLLRVIGPIEFGGGGQTWEVGYKVIREVAKGDGSIGMLLGYHLLWSWTANVVGAVNPRDSDLKITSDGDDIIFNGFKNFNTGGVVSDLTVLEGVYEGSDSHIFAFALTQQPGIGFKHNWHNIGLRLTESGSVSITDVRVPWTDALGWDTSTKAPLSNILSIAWATLLLPTIQLVFSNFYLGIALGSLSYAATYTVKNTRAWPYVVGGDPKSSPVDEQYILSRYGSFHAHLLAATALADQAGKVIADIYTQHGAARDLTARQRGEAAEVVASVKIVATDTALRVAGGVFEVTGSRATASSVGLDRFWRDVRTHTLHDPVAYKEREVGRFVLLDEVPEPTWYT